MNLSNTLLLKDLINRIEYGVFVLDENLNCIETNTYAAQLTANAPEEIKQNNFNTFLNKLDASNFKKAIEDAKKLNEEISIHAQVGKFEKCCLIRCKSLQNLFFVFVKEVEAEVCFQLRNKKEKIESKTSLDLKNLSNIIDSNLSPTLVLNSNYDIVLANQVFEEVFNYPSSKLNQTNINSLFLDEFEFDSSKVNYWNARKELSIKNETGRLIPIDLKINQLSYQGNDYFVFVLRDLRRIKAIERKINHQNKKLKDIAWMHSHIMRQPVTNILAIINAVEASDKIEEKLEFIEMLRECSNQFDSLIKKVFEKTGHKSIVN